MHLSGGGGLCPSHLCGCPAPLFTGRGDCAQAPTSSSPENLSRLRNQGKERNSGSQPVAPPVGRAKALGLSLACGVRLEGCGGTVEAAAARDGEGKQRENERPEVTEGEE